MNIIDYNPTYREELSNFFYKIISQHKEYISHGEIQMGIALSKDEIAPNALQRWRQYLDRQNERNDTNIIICLSETNSIIGFAIAGVESDGAAPYGIIYDLSVDKECRGKGVGSALMSRVISYLKSQNITQCYLESGIRNSSAHHFFERYGFKAVSYIFQSGIV